MQQATSRTSAATYKQMEPHYKITNKKGTGPFATMFIVIHWLMSYVIWEPIHCQIHPELWIYYLKADSLLSESTL